jgi:hypothetical protein
VAATSSPGEQGRISFIFMVAVPLQAPARHRWASGSAATGAATEHVLADQLDQVHRRLGEGDLVAGLSTSGSPPGCRPM